MLRKIRLTLATVFLIGLTLLFLDFTGTAHTWLSWMAKVQFLPAVLAINLLVVVALVVLTLVFGRIYCSIICPLGVMQDLFGWLGKKAKKNRYSYSKEITWLRYIMLGLLNIAVIGGIGSIIQLLAPYSAFGRIATMLLQPLWQMGNNVLAGFAERADSYTFYTVDVWMKSLPVLIIASATLIILAILAWRGGRTYCNTICPVGTLLSFFARYSWMKIQFDADKCRNCSLCAKNCKASCIDFKNHKVDYSRCVVCGDCLESCHFGALSYKPAHKPNGANEANEANATNKTNKTNGTNEPHDASKRGFLLSTALLTTALLAQEKKKAVDGGLAPIKKKIAPERQTPITPPGSLYAKNMQTRCTGCQLCVSECPNHVLRPSTDLMTLMQPVMSYERGYCRPECTRCSEVCPTGAIQRITKEEKPYIQIGHAVVSKKHCISALGEDECGNCMRHCPVEFEVKDENGEMVKHKAIEMVPSDPNDDLSPLIPAVDERRCIGCGNCEYVCPVRPLSAIHVEGHLQHKMI